MYVKVSDNGSISLNCLYLAIFPHLKVTQFDFNVLNLPGYMVRTGGEQIYEEGLLHGPQCCEKTIQSTPKSVELEALPNIICSSEPSVLHSYQN